MSNLKKLKEAKNRKELAEILGFEPSGLSSIVYMTPLKSKYATFEIAKKSGGVRIIKAPSPKLKKLQTHLAHLLYSCLKEIESERQATPVSFGFRKGISETIATNAKKHKRRRYVLNIDLADFFPSFNFGRVRGFFLKDFAFALEEEVATTIAQIACDGIALPQGSPCSPVISELIGQILDVRLLRFAKKHKVTYSRYADDITFSTNQKDFPHALAYQEAANPSVWELGEELIRIIRLAGFEINKNKTRMNLKNSRQTVTGLIVNDKVNIRSEYYRNARAMCMSLFENGHYYRPHIQTKNADEEPKIELIQSLNPLEGILGHIYSITQTEERRSVQEQRKHPRAIRSLYRRFLFYKYCISLKKPLIITEGKTDSIYLREAIKHSPKYQPSLGQTKGSNFEYAVRFFNYEGRAHEIMDLGGGTGDLKSIVMDYLHNTDASRSKRRTFTHKPMLFPVILLLDNDDGIKDVASTLKTVFQVEINHKANDKFYHITQNLYVIKTPEALNSNGKSCIEDFFPEVWRKQTLNNKKFTTSNKIDTEKEYGKEIFAKRVVQPNSKDIDYSGFDPLLDRIVSVINHYKAL